MSPQDPSISIGLISDTHKLLRPEAIAALQNCAHIVHAGDIGSPDVIQGLREIAPLTVIRGNVDTGAWADSLPERATLRLSGKRLHVVHNVRELDLDPAAAGVDVVVFGHSHKPEVTTRGGVLYVNPGSAGPRRFRLPVALAHLLINPTGLSVRRIDLLD